MRMGYIYSLNDPGTGEVRYIGQTVRKPDARLKLHVKAVKNGADNRVYRWMRTLPSPPQINVICTVPENELNDAEIRWIAFARAVGARLTNMTDGGGGVLGYKHSAESLARIGEGNRGKVISQAQRDQISKTLTGKTKGTKLTKEHKDKIAASHTGKPLSEAHKEKLRGPKTKEHRNKLSEIAKNAPLLWCDECQRGWNLVNWPRHIRKYHEGGKWLRLEQLGDCQCDECIITVET
jgi:hypothetical protein